MITDVKNNKFSFNTQTSDKSSYYNDYVKVFKELNGTHFHGRKITNLKFRDDTVTLVTAEANRKNAVKI